MQTKKEINMQIDFFLDSFLSFWHKYFLYSVKRFELEKKEKRIIPTKTVALKRGHTYFYILKQSFRQTQTNKHIFPQIHTRMKITYTLYLL